ncbi:MAG: class I SAM-dependent methyltransferase [Acidimicrobiales bacterium]|nr:class I SAM-dependent methyltransferase [Acidimicrobiales bacterium]
MTTADRGHGAHNRTQLDHFDQRTLHNPRMVVADTPYVNRHVDRVIEIGDLQPGQRLLDVGCGLGKFSLRLLERGFDVTGLDLSAALLADLATRPEAADMALIEADVMTPPAALHGRFDVVTGFFMLHHLPDLEAAFAGVRSCLAPGGVAVFLEPNAYSPLFPIQISLTPGMSWKSDRGVLTMRRGPLLDAFRRAGFGNIEHRWTGLLPPVLANRFGTAFEDRLDRSPVPGPASSFQVFAGRI